MANPMRSRDFMKVAMESINGVFEQEYSKYRKFPDYKLHMKAKDDWLILKLLQWNDSYVVLSHHKSYKEANAVLKLLK